MATDPDIPEAAPSGAGTDLLAGGFFLVWAAVGWYAYLTNERLRASLESPSPDPGPALLALLVLWGLTIGGAAVAGLGLWRLARGARIRGDLGDARAHLRPVAFLVTLVLLALTMRTIGFLVAAGLFTSGWLYALTAGARLSWRHAGLAAAGGVLLPLALHFIFAGLLLVPLPR